MPIVTLGPASLLKQALVPPRGSVPLAAPGPRPPAGQGPVLTCGIMPMLTLRSASLLTTEASSAPWLYAHGHLRTRLLAEAGSSAAVEMGSDTAMLTLRSASLLTIEASSATWLYARGHLRTRLLAEAGSSAAVEMGSDTATSSCARGHLSNYNERHCDTAQLTDGFHTSTTCRPCRHNADQLPKLSVVTSASLQLSKSASVRAR
jgi:hypothetical protein